MADPASDALLDALKRALAEPGEQRLYRRGKLPGLFGPRDGDAAALALRDGLLEPVRTETKGKIVTEWVRLTPRGVEYLHARESPRAVLRELLDAVRTARSGVPLWLEQMRQESQKFAEHLGDQLLRYTRQLEALAARVEEALKRAELVGPTLSDGVSTLVPWGLDALKYLEKRHAGGAGEACPLPELFASLRERHGELSISAFHDGLRRLHDNRAVRLLPFDRPAGELPEPEFALPDGAQVYYFAAR
jgi:hypothetical protein